MNVISASTMSGFMTFSATWICSSRASCLSRSTAPNTVPMPPSPSTLSIRKRCRRMLPMPRLSSAPASRRSAVWSPAFGPGFRRRRAVDRFGGLTRTSLGSGIFRRRSPDGVARVASPSGRSSDAGTDLTRVASSDAPLVISVGPLHARGRVGVVAPLFGLFPSRVAVFSHGIHCPSMSFGAALSGGEDQHLGLARGNRCTRRVGRVLQRHAGQTRCRHALDQGT